MKCYLSLLFISLFALSTSAQPIRKFDAQQTITADSARRSISELLKELALKHPGFYRYNTKSDFDRFIDSSLNTINEPLDQLAYYRKLKPLIARIRCVHTNVSLADNYTAYLNEQTNMLPLDVYFTNGKAFITANYSGNAAVPLGAELLSINGRPMQAIKERLFQMISSDGYNETWKNQALSNRFAQAYRANYEVAKEFKISVATTAGNKEFTLPAVKSEAIPISQVMDLKKQPRLSFNIKDAAAVLTIHSFGETDIKAGGQQFKKFIGQAFKDLKTQHINKLVIDLRNNTGGSDPNAALFCQYLINKPFRYWDRIEATEAFAQSLKGSARLIYGKPVKQDSVYLWRKSKFTREFDFYELQQPQADVYNGKLVILINGACLSSCADAAAVLQYNKRAIFIGEETGGGYQGNNSGLIPDTKITFGIIVSVPLLKYINAVEPGKNIGHGTYPDVTDQPKIDDIINDRDPQMQVALQQLTL